MKGKNFLVVGFALFFCFGNISAVSVLLSDQGTDVKYLNGTLLGTGNLTISIYDSSAGGSLLYNKIFLNNITNGSWNVVLNPDLEYGEFYWKDYEINGDDLNFSGEDRLKFQSPLGEINNASFVNFSLIDSCVSGSSIRQVYENGSVVCEADDSGGNSSWNESYANSKYLQIVNESNLNVNSSSYSNSSSWWNGVSSWIAGWFFNSSGQLEFNETKLNATIDSRAGGDNESWNESYADGKYIFRSNESNLNVNSSSYSNSSSWWNGVSSWIAGWFFNSSGQLEFNETKLNATIDSRAGGDNESWNESYARDLFLENGSNMDLSGYNVTADYYFGNGSLLSDVCLSNGTNCVSGVDTQKNTSGPYLSNDSTTIYFNETKLNGTIDSRDTNETTRFDNLIGNCSADNFVLGIDSDGNRICGTPSGSGDITSVHGDDIYIYNGSDSNGVNLAFNETKLNDTISNEGVNLGFNSTYNATYDAKVSSQWTTTGSDIYYNTGNVGIGTNIPGDKLSVGVYETPNITANQDKTIAIYGDGAAYLRGRDVTNDIEFIMGTSSFGEVFAGSITDHDFSLRTDNTARIVLKNTGDVGVGTSTPQTKFHVNGGILSNGTITATENISADYYFGNGSQLSDVCLSNGTNCVSGVDTQKNTSGPYLSNDSTTIYFNETKLNGTIDSRDTNETTRFDNLVGNCSADNFVLGIDSNGNRICGTPSGSGDITSVQGDDIYIYNGSDSNGVNLAFNETKLNATIDSKAEGLSVNYSSYSNSSSWWNGVSSWIAGWFFNSSGQLEFNETKLNDTIDSRAGGDNSSWNESYARDLFLENGSNINLSDNNVSADYYFGNGSQLSDVCLSNGTNCVSGVDTQKNTSGPYLSNDSTTIFFNETYLNGTIDSRDTNETTRFDNLIGNCSADNFVLGIDSNGNRICGTPSGSGDITSVQGDDIYIYNGSDSNGVNLAFNETKLNATIDSKAEGLSVNYSSYSNSSSWWSGVSSWLSGWFVNDAGNLTFNETKLNDTIDSRAGGDNSSWNESYARDLFLENGSSINLGDNNVSADYYFGNGSQLSDVSSQFLERGSGDLSIEFKNWSATASGNRSISLGFLSVASGDHSTAIGHSTLASGNDSIAAGRGASATDNFATALGYSAVASGESSFATGYFTLSAGDASFSGGDRAKAYGDSSVSIGRETNASGIHSTAIGFLTKAEGENSSAFGNTINVQGIGSFGIGLNNSLYNVTGNNTFAIFGGNVGIGVSNPSEKLEVDGNINVSSGGDICITGGNCLSTVGDNSSWNESYADGKYILRSNESNLSVNYSSYSNSSSWWNGVSSWIAGWFSNNAGQLEFNETKLNDSIDLRGVSVGFNSTFNSTYDSKADYQFTTNNFNGSGNFTTTGNITAQEIRLQQDSVNHRIYDNSSCVIIRGDTSVMYIC